jgi:hypothetical protein
MPVIATMLGKGFSRAVAAALTCGLLLSGVYAGAAPAAGADASAERLSCGIVSHDYPAGQGGSSVRVEAINLRCRAARRVTRLCIVRRHLPNWRVRVSNADGRAALIRDQKRIVMHFVAGGPPFCV